MSTEPEDAVRPPTYTSDGARSARHPSPSPSPSDSDQSLVSAPSRPASPLPSRIESTSQISHLRSPETAHHPSPGPTPLSQGYIVGPYHARVVSSPPPIRPLRQSLDVPSTSSTTKIPIQRAYSRSQPIASVNATNYACILRKTPLHRRFLAFGSATSSITGSFTIDPFLYIPVDLLPPLRKSEKEADRKNLRLEVENGGIDVNINLVGENPSVCRSPVPRTTIGLGIAGGSRNSTFPILARIHTPTIRRPPFHLVAKATNGLVCIHLPRSFHGMVSVSIAVGNLNSHISLSLGMQEQATILSETPQARSYFVGRMGDWTHVGDKAELIVYSGKVSVQFDDEVVRRKGWSTLFA